MILRSALLLLVPLFGYLPSASSTWQFPSHITLRGGVLHAPPFALVEEQEDGTLKYGGFQPDLLERLKLFAAADNITLNFNLSQSPSQYGPALDLVANDCNTTVNPYSLEDCQQFDMIVGNYYATPARALRVNLSPAWLRATISTIKFVDKTGPDYTTLTQASEAKATVCLKDGTFYSGVVKAKFPEVIYNMCPTQDDCLNALKAEECVLYASDELQLRYRAAWDPSLEVTREQFNTQYIVWPLSFNLSPEVSLLMKKWVFDAVTNATLDELYFKYFQKELCPVGTAGAQCELPCDPNHGEADARGICVCSSTKWTGDDCSIEFPENTNNIPTTLKYLAYCMVGINVVTILACAIWLVWRRETTQVRVSQPSFLMLVLLGCLISTSTIIALAEEDEGEGSVKACMFIPWLYSVGFSVTFGTLFAKIRRVYVIFKSAADMRRNIVTVQETLVVIGAVLLVDVTILVVWTLYDPLEWRRTIISADQFGEPLESEGFCTSDHWMAFAGAIAALHLTLLAVACYLCYVSRGIPTKFSEGKYVSIAMISNLQIFVVGVPILIILGTDSQSSFFVRCVVVWMNDFVVVTLIFGNLMYSVHVDPDGTNEETVKAMVGNAIMKYHTSQRGRGSVSRLSSMGSKLDMSAELNRSGSFNVCAMEQHQQYTKGRDAGPSPSDSEVHNSSRLAQSNEVSNDEDSPRRNENMLPNKVRKATLTASADLENFLPEVRGEETETRIKRDAAGISSCTSQEEDLLHTKSYLDEVLEEQAKQHVDDVGREGKPPTQVLGKLSSVQKSQSASPEALDSSTVRTSSGTEEIGDGPNSRADQKSTETDGRGLGTVQTNGTGSTSGQNRIDSTHEDGVKNEDK